MLALRVLAGFALASSLIVPAAADPAATLTAAATPPTSTYDVGFRIGGYGFRREGDPAPGEGWTECRMNGLGVFADRAFRGTPLYLEAGLDGYASSTFLAQAPANTDLPIDRISMLVSVAAGARTQLTTHIRGYVQLGGGVELTHVSVPYGSAGTIRDDLALPEGFFGVGADVRIARGTYVGAMMRLLVMGNFNYDAQKLSMPNQWVAAPQPSDVFAASPDLAMQGQFYVRRDL
jgi:hypothetical protein